MQKSELSVTFSQTLATATAAVSAASRNRPPIATASSSSWATEARPPPSVVSDEAHSEDDDNDSNNDNDDSDNVNAITDQFWDKEEEAVEIEVQENDQEAKDAVAEALLASIDLEGLRDFLNFLPNTDIDDVTAGQAGPGPATVAHCQLRRLINDDLDTRTWCWDETGGWVYLTQKDIHTQWKSLFPDSGQAPAQEYSPFTSKLDWEIAQWAVKEKVSQKAFNRLLQIPEVSIDLNFSGKFLLTMPVS